MILTGLTAAAAVLLVVAGIAKLRTPGPAAAMLVAVVPGVRAVRRARAVTRGAAVVESGVGLTVLLVGGRLAAALLLACWLAVAVVAVRIAAGPQRVPCGCFGAADGDVGSAHVVLDLAAVGIALAALVHPPDGVRALFDSGALIGITISAQAVLLATTGYLSITALPALTAARRPLENS